LLSIGLGISDLPAVIMLSHFYLFQAARGRERNVELKGISPWSLPIFKLAL